jgi:hypothetical protein
MSDRSPVDPGGCNELAPIVVVLVMIILILSFLYAADSLVMAVFK